jgi:tape measure domain-containing protein
VAEEYYRQEIVIDVNDKGVVARIKAMEDRIDKTFNRIEKHGKALSRQRFNPVLELRDRLTDKAEKAQRMLNQLQHTKVTPLVELRGKIENELKHIKSTLKEIDNEYVEPKIRILDRATPVLRKVTEKLGSLAGKTVHVAIKATSKGIEAPFRAVGAAVRNPWALAAVGAAAGYGGIFKPLQLAGQQEQAQIGFSTMLGSKKRANALLNQLQGFANNTPFDYAQIRDQAKRMLAFGFKDKSIVPMMTSIGNASAGLGLGPEGMDRIVTALGQMKAKSKVQSDEMLQLTEAGIPAWDILSKKMGKSTAQVMKLTEKGLVPADKAINVLIDGMNQRFPKMLEKQSHSLFGLFDTMKDTFNNSILEKWGEGIEKSLEPRFEKIKGWINDNGDTIKKWGDTLKRISSDGADWILTKFEGAFSYIRDQYINNPEFQRLDFSGKINFIIDDISDKFSTWFQDKGAPTIAKYGGMIGKELMNNTLTAAENIINNSPLLTLLLGAYIGAKVPGPIKLKVVIGITFEIAEGFRWLMSKINSQAKKDLPAEQMVNNSNLLKGGPVITDPTKGKGLSNNEKKKMQDYLKSYGKGESYNRNTIGSIPAHANGGIFDQPHVGIFAEDGAESLIPMNPRLRDRALGIWSKTGEMLGVKSESDKSSSSGTPVIVQMNGPLIGEVHTSEIGDLEGLTEKVAFIFAKNVKGHLENMA